MDQTCLSSTSQRCSIEIWGIWQLKLVVLLKLFLNHFCFLVGRLLTEVGGTCQRNINGGE